MRLFYLAAFGPMHAQGARHFYVPASSPEDAEALVAPHLTSGYVVERIHEQVEPPAPILRSQPVLHSSLSLGLWWDVHHGVGAANETVSTEGAEQALLF